jgi:Cu/Ag efflux pump CusA
VPVSLIGTFAGLFLLGYSINTLTLFGMVLAIGIVVDDAIVVLENVERIMHEEHLPPARPPSRRCRRSPARSSPSCWCCAPCSCRSPSSAA